ncbi:MAG: hypothetical protein IPM31_10860, partial [Anaerolineae bacterium]|nr:hypothetical protein [Anaerolineae bacterium]
TTPRSIGRSNGGGAWQTVSREVAGLISADEDVDDVLDGSSPNWNATCLWMFPRSGCWKTTSCTLTRVTISMSGVGGAVWFGGSIRRVDASRSFSNAEIRKPTDPLWVSGYSGRFRPELFRAGRAVARETNPCVITHAHNAAGRYGREAQAGLPRSPVTRRSPLKTRLYDVAQEQAYASAALLQVAQAIVSLNDLDEILGTIIRIMPILTGVQRAALYQWDASHEQFVPTQNYGLSVDDERQFGERSFSPG